MYLGFYFDFVRVIIVWPGIFYKDVANLVGIIGQKFTRYFLFFFSLIRTLKFEADGDGIF